MKDYRRRREEAIENFGKPGRDPAELGSVMTTIAGNGVWAANMKLAQLRNHWDQVVGQAIASHSAVADFTDGVLTIRAESTVWATQLTYLIPQLTDTIRRNLKGLTIARDSRDRTRPPDTRANGLGGGSQDTKQIRRSLAMALVGLDE